LTLNQVIGELLPAAFHELVSQVLRKYNLPPPSPDYDTPLEDALASGVSIDDLRNDIYQGLHREMLWGVRLAPFLSPLRQMPADMPLSQALTQFASTLPPDLTVGNTIHRYIDSLFDPILQRLADQLTLYALTGKTLPTPENSFGGAFTIPIPGQPLIGLVADQFADTQSLIRQFRHRFRGTFPAKPRAISSAMITAATTLRHQLEGYNIKDVADIYIARHPSEFPKDPLTPKYRNAKKRQEERIRKQILRLKSLLQAFRDS